MTVRNDRLRIGAARSCGKGVCWHMARGRSLNEARALVAARHRKRMARLVRETVPEAMKLIASRARQRADEIARAVAAPCRDDSKFMPPRLSKQAARWIAAHRERLRSYEEGI